MILCALLIREGMSMARARSLPLGTIESGPTEGGEGAHNEPPGEGGPAPDGDRRRALLPQVHSNTTISAEGVRQIRAATALPRDFRDDELAHWLWEAARQYHLNAMSSMPWQRVIAHAEKVEATTRKLLTLLRAPESVDTLPSVGAFIDGMSAGAFVEALIQDLERLRDRARLGQRMQGHQRDRFLAAKWASDSGREVGPDCHLIGGHLPLVFDILYGRPRKGEAPGAEGRARDRFIAASCAALGLPPAGAEAIKKHRERYRRHFQVDGLGLLPPRNPSPACLPRIRAWYDRVEEAERVRAARAPR